jgi:hypothetical protein
MAATIFYTVTNGAMPVTVELTPSFIPANVHTETGTYSFINVEDGEYTLIFTDSNGCVYEKEIIVNPFVTTTTTTVVPGDRMIVGQSQDTLLIFNEDATNRSEHYFGDTPVDTNIILYLWFKTLNGEPLTSNKTVLYSITAINPVTGVTGSSQFTYLDVSDQIHAEVIESMSGPSKTIAGTISFQAGFIETYFKYRYQKDLVIPDYQIDLNAYANWLDPNILLTGGTNTYGVVYVDGDNMILKF